VTSVQPEREDAPPTEPEPQGPPCGRVGARIGARAPVFGVFMELYRAALAGHRPDRRPRRA
jgi:hypothetical protein